MRVYLPISMSMICGFILRLNDLGKISNCNFSDQYYGCDAYCGYFLSETYPCFSGLRRLSTECSGSDFQLVVVVMSQHVTAWLLLIGLTQLQMVHMLCDVRLTLPVKI